MRSVADVAAEHADAHPRAAARAASPCSTPTTRYVDVWRDAARDARRARRRVRARRIRPRCATAALHGGARRARSSSSTPAGDATVRARRARPAQRRQRARRRDRGAGDRRPARRGRRAASRRFRAGAPAGSPTHVAASGAAVIDDTYNANPDSVRAAIDVLAARAGAALARAGRHGRGRRAGPGVPPRDRRVRARSGHRPRCSRPGALAAEAAAAFGAGAAHFASVEALAAARRRAGRAPARRCWSRARASCGWSASSPRSRRPRGAEAH